MCKSERMSEPDPQLGGLDEEVRRLREAAVDSRLPKAERYKAAIRAKAIAHCIYVMAGKVVGVAGVLAYLLSRTRKGAAIALGTGATGTAVTAAVVMVHIAPNTPDVSIHSPSTSQPNTATPHRRQTQNKHPKFNDRPEPVSTGVPILNQPRPTRTLLRASEKVRTSRLPPKSARPIETAPAPTSESPSLELPEVPTASSEPPPLLPPAPSVPVRITVAPTLRMSQLPLPTRLPIPTELPMHLPGLHLP
jgi:hypothetical protein